MPIPPPSSSRGRRAPKFRTHIWAHKAVIGNGHWYGDGPPELGKQFTANKTDERQQAVVEILVRVKRKARKAGDENLAEAYKVLAKKLKACCPKHRCASLACPKCGRAFQRAKTAAQEEIIAELRKSRQGKKLVMITLIPLGMTFPPDDMDKLNIPKRNLWLKDRLAAADGFRRVMLGSLDISWERRKGERYFQIHWHIGMWTSNRKKLLKRLKEIFPAADEHDRPVVVSKTWSLGFLPYKDKAIKLPELLRHNRTQLPELLLLLDRTEPLELLVLKGLRLSAQNGGIKLGPIGKAKVKSGGDGSYRNCIRKRRILI